jgi:hypothetical protein
MELIATVKAQRCGKNLRIELKKKALDVFGLDKEDAPKDWGFYTQSGVDGVIIAPVNKVCE